MLVGPQLVGVAATPLTVTVLDPNACVAPKFVPVIVRLDPGPPVFELSWVTVGGARTARLAVLLVPPVPPSIEVTAVVVLLIEPGLFPVTLTLKVQDPLAPSVPLAKLTELEPATAVMVPVPQEPLTPLGVDTTSPPVSVSLKPTPLNEVESLLLMVKDNEVDPPCTIAPWPNALVM